MPSATDTWQINNVGDYTRWVLHADSSDDKTQVDTVRPGDWLTHKSGLWKIDDLGDDVVKIRNAMSDKYIAPAEVKPGSIVKIGATNQSDIQKWKSDTIGSDTEGYYFIFRPVNNPHLAISVQRFGPYYEADYSYLVLQDTSPAQYPKHIFMLTRLNG